MPSIKRTGTVVALGLLVLPSPANAAPWKYSHIVMSAPAANRIEEVALSASGRVVVMVGRIDPPPAVYTPTDAVRHVVAYDTVTRKSTLVTTGVDGKPGNSWSDHVTVSADGRYAAFESNATNLVAGDTNGRVDVFVRDLVKRRTSRIGLTLGGKELPAGATQPALSADGSTIAFNSCSDLRTGGKATVACGLWVRNLRTGRTVGASLDKKGVMQSGFEPTLSANGRYVCSLSPGSYHLTEDTPDTYFNQAYVFDTAKGTRFLVPMEKPAAPGATVMEASDATIDPTGNWVALRELPEGTLAATGDPTFVLTNLTTGAVTVLGLAGRPMMCCTSPPVFSGDSTALAYSLFEVDPAGQSLDVVYRRTVRSGATERLSATPAAPCATDLGCTAASSAGVALDRKGERIVLATSVRYANDDPDGWNDAYLLTR
jgi:hypothetical protein